MTLHEQAYYQTLTIFRSERLFFPHQMNNEQPLTQKKKKKERPRYALRIIKYKYLENITGDG